MGKLLAPKDAAVLLGLSSRRVQQLADAGVLPAVRNSLGYRAFRESDVLKLRRAREKAARRAEGRKT